MSLKGHLGTIPLPELLQWLAIGRKTGTLVLTKDGGVHRVLVEEGRVVSTATSEPEGQLGRRLVAKGLIDQETLERAMKLREATQMPLGRVLLTLQVLPERGLKDALKEKAEALVASLFYATDVKFHFVEGDSSEDSGLPLSLDATQLVLSAAHHLEQPPTDELPLVPAEEEPPPVQAAASAGREPAAVASPPSTDQRQISPLETLPEKPPSPAHRGRALGGLAAAAALIAVLTTLLIVFRQSEPAGAQDSIAQLATTVGRNAPVAASTAAVLPGTTLPSAPLVVELSELAPPAPPPAETEPQATDLGARIETLLATQAEELRGELDDQYRGELADLRRQLAQARAAARSARQRAAAGEAAAGTSPERVASAAPIPASRPAEPPEVPVIGLPEAMESPPLALALETLVLPPEPAAALAEPDPRAELAGDRSAAVAPDNGAAGSAAPADVTVPQLISRPVPAYPLAALRLGREAEVTVRVLVAQDGSVQEIQPTGRKAGLGFDQAAARAAEASVWRPAMENGVPVSRWVELRFSFEIP